MTACPTETSGQKTVLEKFSGALSSDGRIDGRLLVFPYLPIGWLAEVRSRSPDLFVSLWTWDSIDKKPTGALQISQVLASQFLRLLRRGCGKLLQEALPLPLGAPRGTARSQSDQLRLPLSPNSPAPMCRFLGFDPCGLHAPRFCCYPSVFLFLGARLKICGVAAFYSWAV